MSRGPRSALLPCALAALMAAAVYANALRNPFVYDDHIHVVQRASSRSLADLPTWLLQDRFRPVVNLSYAVDHWLGGQKPLGYHLTSLLLHCLNVVLLLLLVDRVLGDLRPRPGGGGRREDPLGARRWGAFAAAGLFAVHPLLSEGVAYISGRAEVLCAALFLLAFLALRRRLLGGRWGWTALGLALMTLGVGAKEHGAMLPFVLLAYDRLVLAPDQGEAAARRLWRFHLPLLGLVLAAACARAAVLLWVEYPTLLRPVGQNLFMQFSVIWRYIFLLLLPTGQSVVHQVRPVTTLLDPMAIGAGAALASLVVLALLLRRQAPAAVLGLLWFFLLIAPSSSLIPLLEPMAEHRVYLASAGAFIALGAGLWRLLAWVHRRGSGTFAPQALLVVLLMSLGVATVRRNRVWADPVTLWSDAAAKAPGVWAPHYALGDAHRRRGNCDRAMDAYREAIKILPEEPRAYLNLGICLAEAREDEAARRAFSSVLTLEPGNPQALKNLGTLAVRGERWDEAEGYFKEALARDPRDPRALSQLGVVAEARGEWRKALRLFQTVAQLDGANVFALYHLAYLYETRFDELDRALRLYRRIKELAPDTPGVDQAAARVLETLRRKL